MEQTEKLQNKIQTVEDALLKVLDDEGLDVVTVIDFPKYREVPMHVQLAMSVLEQEGAVIIRKYSLKAPAEKLKESK